MGQDSCGAGWGVEGAHSEEGAARWVAGGWSLAVERVQGRQGGECDVGPEVVSRGAGGGGRQCEGEGQELGMLQGAGSLLRVFEA